MEDDEGWVLPVSRFKSTKISTVKTHGTPHAVAAPVDSFPFLPPDNRRHEPHRSATTTTPPVKHNSCSISSRDASNYAHTPCALLSPITCNCPFYCRGKCQTTASLRQTQSESLSHHTTPHSISLDDAPPNNPTPESPQRQPVDLAAIRAEIQANLDDLARRFPPPMTMTTTLPSRQPDHPLPSPPSVSTTPLGPPQREVVDLAAIQAEIRTSMERLDRLFPLPLLTPTTLPLPNSEPPLPLPTPPATTDTEATATPLLPLRTRIDRLLSNAPVSNAALWMPDIVYRRVTRRRSTELDPQCSSNPIHHMHCTLFISATPRTTIYHATTMTVTTTRPLIYIYR